ncbi:MAG: hypothetical protein QOC58_663 [Mycobacterium sp.]|nr:hypothetical protein [Mycobacterium sp.]
MYLLRALNFGTLGGRLGLRSEVRVHRDCFEVAVCGS